MSDIPVESGPLSGPACERCGTFGPRIPHAGRALCRACIERAWAQAGSTLRLRDVLADTWRLARPILGRALLSHHLAAVPQLARTVYGGDERLGGVMDLVLNAIAHVLVVDLALQGTDGQAASVKSALLRMARRSGVLVRTLALSGLYSTLLLLALVVPGVLRWLDYFVVVPLALCESDTARAALTTSRQRMYGARGRALYAYLACALPPFIPPLWYSVHQELANSGAGSSAPSATPLLITLLLAATTITPLLSVMHAALYLRTLPVERVLQRTAPVPAS